MVPKAALFISMTQNFPFSKSKWFQWCKVDSKWAVVLFSLSQTGHLWTGEKKSIMSPSILHHHTQPIYSAKLIWLCVLRYVMDFLWERGGGPLVWLFLTCPNKLPRSQGLGFNFTFDLKIAVVGGSKDRCCISSRQRPPPQTPQPLADFSEQQWSLTVTHSSA